MSQSTKNELDEIANAIAEAHQRLGFLINSDEFKGVDLIAAKRTCTDLLWAVENSTILGLHAIGEAMDDNMGITPLEESDKDDLFTDPKFAHAYKRSKYPDDLVALTKMWLEEEKGERCFLEVIPLMCDDDHIFLQFNGWGIKLRDDGSWSFDPDTSGG